MQKKHILISAIGTIVILLIAGSLVWLYTGPITNAKENVFKKLPLPAALVSMKFVTANEVINRVNLTKKAGGESGSAYDMLIDRKKLEDIANGKNIKITSSAIDEEYSSIVDQYAQGNSSEFEQALQKTYGMTPDEFKDQVVSQRLTQAYLALWYNQQENLNSDSYKTAHDLQNQLSSGGNFDDIAKTYTQDEATKDFAGDSGMISFDDLLPEFRSALQDSKSGDVKLIASRYGLHILKVVDINNDGENGSKQIHLQQIFVQTKGFEDWLKKETDNIRVIKLIKTF
jgi:parvulin-like peptidyl-prolyl isomerase